MKRMWTHARSPSDRIDREHQMQRGWNEILESATLLTAKAAHPHALLISLAAEATHVDLWPYAATLATVGRSGPSARAVLTSLLADCILFGANSTSPKIQDLSSNPDVELCYLWPNQGMQVRVTGTAGLLTSTESDQVFDRLPPGIKDVERVSALNKTILEPGYQEALTDASALRHSRPPDWVAVRVRPAIYRFWVSYSDDMRLSLVCTPTGGPYWQVLSVPA